MDAVLIVVALVSGYVFVAAVVWVWRVERRLRLLYEAMMSQQRVIDALGEQGRVRSIKIEKDTMSWLPQKSQLN